MSPSRTALPSNVAAERALIGAVLDRGDRAYVDVLDLVRPDDFFSPYARSVWIAMDAAREAGRTCGDRMVLEEQLARSGAAVPADPGGWMGFLVACAAECPIPAQVREYARLVRDDAMRREACATIADVYRATVARRLDPSEIAAACSSLATKLQERDSSSGADMPELCRAVYATAVEVFEKRRKVLAPPFDDLRTPVIPLLHGGDMLVIGARPKRGKSNLAGDLAFGWAVQGHPGIILSAEDAPEDWVRREAAKRMGVEPTVLRSPERGQISAAVWHTLTPTLSAIHKLPAQCEWMAGRRACDFAAKILVAAQRKGARWAVVDYLQVVRPTTTRRGASREEETAATVAELKAAAIRAGVVLVLVSQLSRGEDKSGKEDRPTPADLRNSGMIEAQADAVVLMWRPRPKNYEYCRMWLALHKHGPTREVEINWLPASRRVWAFEGPRAVLDEQERS